MELRRDEDRRRVEGGGEKQGRHRGSETREREKAKGREGKRRKLYHGKSQRRREKKGEAVPLLQPFPSPALQQPRHPR